MVSRSTGCLLCVQRRVKCDERRPGCVRCETYGRPCPGYSRGFRFVAGKPYRSRRRPRISNIPSDGESHPNPAADINSNTDHEIMAMVNTNPYTLHVGNFNVTECLGILAHEISQPFPSTSGFVISRWLMILPFFYGRSKTLDSTVRTFVAHHIGSITQNQQAVQYARSSYQEALRRLRLSLNSRSESLSSEVYCSVLLLCLYELFANPLEGDSWMQHAKGLSQLTEARGPSRYYNEFDSILLKATRGLIVMQSLFGGEKCLLASDEWHFVMGKQHNPGSSVGKDNLVEQFFAYFTLSPSLVHQLYSLQDADQADPNTLVKVSAVLSQTLDMQKKLACWYDKFSNVVPIPHEVRSSIDDPVFPTVLAYSDVNSSTIYCGYYSYMAIIHEILKTCGYPGEHAGMSFYFRDQICKSVEYTAQGLLGPYRMGFPLKVAYEVSDPLTKAWIEGCLKKFSTFYGILRRDKF